MAQDLAFHHIGIFVKDLEAVSGFYIKIFGMEELLRRKAKYVKDFEEVEIIFLKKGSFLLELIGPAKFNNVSNKVHVALTLKKINSFIKVLKEYNIEYDLYYNENGLVDLIKFKDPEYNLVEIFEKKASYV